MSRVEFEVVAMGNALVDVIADVEEGFLTEQGLVKGSMTLIDAERAEQLYAAMPPAIEISGGSAGNTIAGVASFGARAAYIGQVADDQLGRVFRHDIRASGVAYDVPPGEGEAPTGRCLIAVTPDAQRTMNTFLGAGVDLGPEDVPDGLIRSAKVTYLEGYLWDPPRAKEAFVKAAELAHAAERKVALTLSDSFCVERHRADFLGLVERHIDILFANEAEIRSLYRVDSFDEALKRVRGHCEIAALTRSEKGSVIATKRDIFTIKAASVPAVIDTTGAGDLYAAGFLFGYTQDLALKRCGELASLAAAEVISHYGARPEISLRSLL
jgi:sugar/nucleoside kinase (ribokinase family)